MLNNLPVGPLHTTKISLSKEWDMNYWSVTLRCSIPELTKTIGMVGSNPKVIEGFLKCGSASLGNNSTFSNTIHSGLTRNDYLDYGY